MVLKFFLQGLTLRLQAFQVRSALEGGRLEEVGRLLEESWQIKRMLVDGITGELLDNLHDQLIDAGATGAAEPDWLDRS